MTILINSFIHTIKNKMKNKLSLFQQQQDIDLQNRIHRIMSRKNQYIEEKNKKLDFYYKPNSSLFTGDEIQRENRRLGDRLKHIAKKRSSTSEHKSKSPTYYHNNFSISNRIRENAIRDENLKMMKRLDNVNSSLNKMNINLDYQRHRKAVENMKKVKLNKDYSNTQRNENMNEYIVLPQIVNYYKSK